ncbi:MAG: SDR family oxidoreductase [Thermodesulfobacteriota bacterium]
MKILITGGLGYIGGRIANYLKREAEDIKISLTTRNKDRKLPSWAKEFEILQMDVLEKESIDKCLDGVEVVIHLAALNEIDSLKDPQSAWEINVKGTFNLLELSRTKGIKKFIYFSTFHVYGNPSNSIITEETPTKPFHPYSITHRAAEDFVRYFEHYYGIKTLILRLSNGYGYPMDKDINRWTLVFNDLCRQAVTTGKIRLKSSGRQYRDFISIEDIARAVYHFIFVLKDKWGDGLYNLGGNCAISILNAAQKVAEVCDVKYGKKIKLEVPNEKTAPEVLEMPFTYSIQKIMYTGFTLKSEMDKEILKTLSVCEEFL